MKSLWRAFSVDRAYYVFWGSLAVLLVGVPGLLILRKLEAIRAALEALSRR